MERYKTECEDTENGRLTAFVDPGLIILEDEEKQKRINRHGESFWIRDPRPEWRGMGGLYPGTEGDTMWLQGIETENGPRDRKFTDKPRFTGDLYLAPCDVNEWYNAYDWDYKECIEDIDNFAPLPGPFTGPTLAPVIDRIKAIVKGRNP